MLDIAEIDADFHKSDYFVNRKIGLVALRTDHLIEDNLRQILGPFNLAMLTNRIRFNDPVNTENLKAMAQDLDRVVGDILPGKALDLVIFGCSSGAAAIGEAKLAAKIKAIKPSAKVTNPVTAAVASFAALGVKKISVITPYSRAVNESIADFFSSKGYQVLNIAGFNQGDDADITRIDPQAIVAAAKQYAHPEAEALFLSCTALRATDVIEEIELALNLPVVSSNQALAWHALNLMAVTQEVQGYGRLFQCKLPSGNMSEEA